MEKRGLVERRHGTGDRRMVLVQATGAGEQVFHDMAAHHRDDLSRVLAELTEEEVTALLVGMRAIHAAKRRALEQDLDPNGASPPGPETVATG
jgi:DNA-binding MarR family transcriptional regulator